MLAWYLSGVRCRLAYGPADATATHVQIDFTFLVPAHLGSPEKRAVKCVYVYVVYKCCAGIGDNTAHRQRDAQ